ncbi:MAG: formate dehydrogenase accessory sulfurtransferase FdhD [Gammaproteobacteria bacterium]|nr:formate dehydrogenase accessory sulfurtransferase FdhD [Gammaproteobacteria bacterium]MDH5323316.1 formate dehydrogenase accessory sulfurtransferase FdhD [Gammaproteobacteria bacterium]
MSPSNFAVTISKVRDGVAETLADDVAVEEPLEIRLGYSTPDGRATRSISITMRTPGHDRELAAGFLYTEGIVHQRQEIASIEPCGPAAPDSGNHNVIRIDLANGVEVDLGRLQRHFYTTSSCGVCGKTSLEALRVAGAQSQHGNTTRFRRPALVGVPGALRSAQLSFDTTGGLHAAAAFSPEGDLITIMEDVGRHNAVDKVLGSLLLNNELPATGLGLMVSGRASFELMQKTLLAGMPLLAAISAPSSLAVQLAREFHMSLIGFLRGDTFNIYAGAERIVE